MDDKRDKIQTWLVVIIIAVVVFISFILMMTQGFREWLTVEIPNQCLRTICAALIQVIIIIIVMSVLFSLYCPVYDTKKQRALSCELFID
jgi:NADH:ubiquinone oxidoreductase subunit 6 (subunit J)